MKKAIFLDRDGTINEDSGYLYRIEDFIYKEGAEEGLDLLYRAGYTLVVITNQSGIARGLFTQKDYERLTSWMQEDLKRKGVILSGCYHCPHLPDASVPEYAVKCRCRKPGTYLFEQAIRELSLQPEGSFAIGDRLRDLCICKTTPVKGILLSDSAPLSSEAFGRIIVKKDLLQAAKYIVQGASS